MTRPPLDESAIDRIGSALAFAAFCAAFACLAAGLVLWLARPSDPTGDRLLVAGLLGLLGLPILKLLMIIAAAIRQRDWLLLGATVTVLAILFTLTIRDAAL